MVCNVTTPTLNVEFVCGYAVVNTVIVLILIRRATSDRQSGRPSGCSSVGDSDRDGDEDKDDDEEDEEEDEEEMNSWSRAPSWTTSRSQFQTENVWKKSWS